MSTAADTMGQTVATTAEDLSNAVTYGVEAYTSEEYVRAERDKLWRKVWQQVGRVEEAPEVGSFFTYDILDDSILIVRTAMSGMYMRSLANKVAVVTGASRGIGKGIALALAEEGATVYVTGRTVTPDSYPLPGTVGETAVDPSYRRPLTNRRPTNIPGR